MPKERKPSSFLGHTKWEKFRNVAGLVLILGFVASKYINVNLEHVSTVKIRTSDYGISSKETLQASVRSFQPNEGNLTTVSKAIQSTVQDIKENIAISFVIGEASPFVLVIECTSKWPKEKVGPVCETFGSEFKSYLKSLK